MSAVSLILEFHNDEGLAMDNNQTMVAITNNHHTAQIITG